MRTTHFLFRSGIPNGEPKCSGLIAPDTLMRDNISQQLRCHYESEAYLQAVPERV